MLLTFPFSEGSVEVEFILAQLPSSAVGYFKSAFESVEEMERVVIQHHFLLVLRFPPPLILVGAGLHSVILDYLSPV